MDREGEELLEFLPFLTDELRGIISTVSLAAMLSSCSSCIIFWGVVFIDREGELFELFPLFTDELLGKFSLVSLAAMLSSCSSCIIFWGVACMGRDKGESSAPFSVFTEGSLSDFPKSLCLGRVLSSCSSGIVF